MLDRIGALKGGLIGGPFGESFFRKKISMPKKLKGPFSLAWYCTLRDIFLVRTKKVSRNVQYQARLKGPFSFFGIEIFFRKKDSPNLVRTKKVSRNVQYQARLKGPFSLFGIGIFFRKKDSPKGPPINPPF